MEQNFQTSFIPKKPLTEERVVRSRPIGMLAIICIFIFFATLVASGGMYFYKGVLNNNIKEMQKNLELAKGRFELSKITLLQELDKRLNGANDILSNHVAVSPIFDALQQYTLKTVRYTKFSYTLGKDANSNVDVKMSGQAIGYRSIALQSDLFSQHKDNIIDPVFSNLSLDNKGNVLFDLEFSVNPTFIKYTDLIKNNLAASQ